MSAKIARLYEASTDINGVANDPSTIVNGSDEEDKENPHSLAVQAGETVMMNQNLASPTPTVDGTLMPPMHDDSYLHPPISEIEMSNATEYEEIADITNNVCVSGDSTQQDQEYMDIDRIEKVTYEELSKSSRAVTHTEGKIYQELTKTQ